jgi:hypothetical protein
MPTGTLTRDDREGAARCRPALFRALGEADPPLEIEVRGCRLRQVTVFKHDSWAATALYAGEGHGVVCKFNRREPIFGIPMTWLGRALARREARMLKLLADEPHVPAGCGSVRVNGRKAPTAVAHDFVPGRPLRIQDDIAPGFFDELDRLVARLHRRRIAYIDLHKLENILVGADGRPWLIDFQISVRLPHVWPLRWLLRMLQESDRYHCAKHRFRQHHGLDSLKLFRECVKTPWWIRLHRTAAIPFRTLRRRLLVAAGIRTGEGLAHTEAMPEVGLRKAA